MFITCWSVKGGVGTTVVAAALAVGRARTAASGVLLVDLAGDQPHALGMAEPVGPGVAEWSSAGSAVPPDALARLRTEVSPGLAVLHRGRGPIDPTRAEVLASVLAREPVEVIVDAGRLDVAPAGVTVGVALAGAADRSLLVIRPCQLGLFRARHLPVQPDAVVVVREPARVLGRGDVEQVVGVRAIAELAVDPAVARAVDAGLLASRLPRSFAAAVEQIR